MTAQSPSRRLKTWKEIAGYIHRDTRTAKRYEAERGLPVHRMPGGGKSVVFAYPEEIDEWLRSAETPASEPPGAPSGEPPTPADNAPATSRARWRLAAAALLAMAVTVGGATWGARAWRAGDPPTQTADASADPKAQALYLSGRFAWNRRTAADLRRAAGDFAQATTLDPRFAAAYVGLADTYNLMPEFGGLAPADAYPRARAAATRAVSLAPSSAAAHRALGFTLFYWYRDLPGSDREFRKALALDPRSAQTHHWYATALAARGDYAPALAEIEKAVVLDPTNPAIKADEGWVLYVGGRYGEALKLLQEVQTVAPDYVLAYLYMADVYEALGRPSGMLDEWRHAAALNGDRRLLALEGAGRSALAGGPRAVLESITAEAERRYAAGEGSPFALAVYEMRLGRGDRSLAYLEDCIRRRDPAAVAIPTTAVFDPLKPLPRFQRIALAARTAG